MCLHVTLKGCRRSHNALFRRVRFSSPGQTSSHLTERHSLHYRLTERRSVRDCLHTECVFWSGCASDRGDTGVKWERRSVHRSPKMAYRRRFGRLCTLLRCKRLQSALFLTWANAVSPYGKTHSAPPPHGKAHSATRLMDEASTPRSQAIQAAFHVTGSGDPLPSLSLSLKKGRLSVLRLTRVHIVRVLPPPRGYSTIL